MKSFFLKNTISYINTVLLFLVFLQTLLFWPALYYNNTIVLLMACLTLGFLLIKNLVNWTGCYTAVIYSLLCLSCYIIIYSGISGSVTIVLSYTLGYMLIHCTWRFKQKLLHTVTKWFGILISISLTFYIIHLFFPFDFFNILKEPFGYRDHFNYIAYITPSVFPDRFSGPFIEPGHLSVASVFLIYSNKFDFKSNKYLWPILTGVLLSLSLAGYLLLIIGFLLSPQNNIKISTIILIIGSLVFLFVRYVWEDGNNPVNVLIFDRLEYDEDKGIVGNNRTQGNTELYWNLFWDNGDIICGKSSEYMAEMTRKGQIEGAGYKLYIIRYGLLGTFFTFLYYLSITIYAVDKRTAFRFLLLIIICFIQRAYPYWLSWLLPFICSLDTRDRYTLKEHISYVVK